MSRPSPKEVHAAFEAWKRATYRERARIFQHLHAPHKRTRQTPDRMTRVIRKRQGFDPNNRHSSRYLWEPSYVQ
jgi:hypothetical protein